MTLGTKSPASVRAVMAAARQCAFVMLENAMYIQGELPVFVPALDDAMRRRIEQTCTELIGTKHDILTEVDELAGLLAAPTKSDAIGTRVERIGRWLGDDVMQVHELVHALAAAQSGNPNAGAACVLVTEAAANIVRSYAEVRAAISARVVATDGEAVGPGSSVE